MDFNPEKKLITPTKKEIKAQNENRKAEIITELDFWATKNGNPLVFVDYGLNADSELIKNAQIDEKILKGLDKKKTELFKIDFEKLKSFLQGPIFTDSFHKKKYPRFVWIDSYHKELSKEASQYYEANRLRFQKCFDVINFFTNIQDLLHDSDLKNKLLELKKNIPPEFLTKDKNGSSKYSNLSDTAKVKVIKELTEIAQTAVLLLMEK